jgi:YVTN family beta-propeller protein
VHKIIGLLRLVPYPVTLVVPKFLPVRPLIPALPALVILLSGCGGSASRDKQATRSSSVVVRGPDQILLRIPRRGGEAQAYIYPKLDSLIWGSDAVPAIDRILAFDPEAGLLAIQDAKGNPVRVDLRLGEVNRATKTKLKEIASINGSDIYGLTSTGGVVRAAPSAEWVYSPPGSADAVFPQPDGSIVIVHPRGKDLKLYHVRPPDTDVLDSARISMSDRYVTRQVGDRLYIGGESGIVGIDERRLETVSRVSFTNRVVALVATPSGDRLYVANAGQKKVSIINRYTDKVTAEIPLPGAPIDLRMDPFGRYLLARASKGDSAWVIAIGTEGVIGSIQSDWKSDLPTVAPDGAIATIVGKDVVFLDGETLQAVRTVSNGAADYWYFFLWNGFRPRAAGLDRPVDFTERDTPYVSTPPPPQDTAKKVDTTVSRPPPPPPPTETTVTRPPATGYIVSFAAMLSEERAKAEAALITVNGQHPRVVPSQRAGTTIYRVVMGPYPTKEEAERIGREAKHQFWVFEGSL